MLSVFLPLGFPKNDDFKIRTIFEQLLIKFHNVEHGFSTQPRCDSRSKRDT